eukprot:6709177-Prymnesium_polylepis.1
MNVVKTCRDTAGPLAVEYTHIYRRPVPAHTAVSKHRPRPAQACVCHSLLGAVPRHLEHLESWSA